MEEFDKNKNSSQTDITNKQNMVESDTNNTFDEKASDEVRKDTHQKIKINEQKLKEAKEKTMEIKSDSNKESNLTEDINQKNNNIYMNEKRYYFRINRFLGGKRKKYILIILLIISSFFLFISLADILNSYKNIYNNDKLLINNKFIFMLQIVYIFTLFIFQILIMISQRKDNFIINLIFLITICALMITKIFLFIKSINSSNIAIFHFFICFCLTSINLIILLITLRIIKMKKSVQQNIEEIINFTEMGQATGILKINEKNNQLMLNSSGTDNKSDNDIKNNNGGMTGLVEEINNKENGDNDNKGQK